LIVFFEKHDATPKPFVMKERMNLAQLQAEFGESSTVFVANKNLQCYPKGMRGALIWVPLLAVIATMIYSNGVEAVVSVLYPTHKKGKKALLDLTVVGGQYLNYETGPNPNALPIDSKFRSREGDVMLTDRNGCVKMSIEGGDIYKLVSNTVMLNDGTLPHCNEILEPGSGAVAHKVKHVLTRNPLTTLKTETLPKRDKQPPPAAKHPRLAKHPPPHCKKHLPPPPVPGKRRRTRGRKNFLSRPQALYNVDVVYVYRPDPELYSHVETYLVGDHDQEIEKYLNEDAENYLDQLNISSKQMRRLPIYSIPIGQPFGDPSNKNSPPSNKRYVC
jgi:hypothetical protein